MNPGKIALYIFTTAENIGNFSTFSKTLQTSNLLTFIIWRYLPVLLCQIVMFIWIIYKVKCWVIFFIQNLQRNYRAAAASHIQSSSQFEFLRSASRCSIFSYRFFHLHCIEFSWIFRTSKNDLLSSLLIINPKYSRCQLLSKISWKWIKITNKL